MDSGAGFVPVVVETPEEASAAATGRMEIVLGGDVRVIVGAMLARAQVLARGGHAELRKQAGESLRNAAERFCKEMLVRDRWTKYDKGAALSDYDGKNLGQLEPKVEPLLTADQADKRGRCSDREYCLIHSPLPTTRRRAES